MFKINGPSELHGCHRLDEMIGNLHDDIGEAMIVETSWGRHINDRFMRRFDNLIEGFRGVDDILEALLNATKIRT